MIALSDGELYLEVHEAGAYVSALRRRDVDVLLRGDPRRPTKGGMAFLAPYANRVRGGSYEFEGRRYELPRSAEGHAIHGLVLDSEFEVEDLEVDRVSLKGALRHPGYPSELLLRVTYELGGLLMASAAVTNVGERRAPLVVGWHPYFLVKGGWAIRPSGQALRCESVDRIPTGRLVPHSFGPDGSYDDCFYVESGEVELDTGEGSILVRGSGMRFFQVYTGVPGAVAVEPMSGAPDAYHNGLGLTVIGPGETREFSFTVSFRP